MNAIPAMKRSMTKVSRLCVVTMLCAAAVVPVLRAQTTPAPEKRYTNKEIAQRPYSETLPKPIYPSSPREQKQFNVNYVYNYAQSTYTPAVELPKVVGAPKDTPESALTGLYSAMQAGDYDAMLLCWDENSRAEMVRSNLEAKRDVTFWRTLWAKTFTGSRVLLTNRIEMVGYIIIDTQIVNKADPSKFITLPNVLKAVHGEWMMTNELSSDQMLMSLEPGKPKVAYEFNVAPVSGLNGPMVQVGDAQKKFLESHTKTIHVDVVVR